MTLLQIMYFVLLVLGIQCIPMMIMITITLFGFKKRTLGIDSDRQIELRMLKELKKAIRSTIHLDFIDPTGLLIQFKVSSTSIRTPLLLAKNYWIRLLKLI